ncbi:UNVERIFIED_CONTAM: hypothetical protein HHA_449220 [Hammondia hammondi]|eukprot:XP_008881813.1 hypothetical protein HHA_449220 [Hammondia hammondi]
MVLGLLSRQHWSRRASRSRILRCVEKRFCSLQIPSWIPSAVTKLHFFSSAFLSSTWSSSGSALRPEVLFAGDHAFSGCLGRAAERPFSPLVLLIHRSENVRSRLAPN